MHMIVPSRESILCVSTRHGTTKTRLKLDVSALYSFNNLSAEYPLINTPVGLYESLRDTVASARRAAPHSIAFQQDSIKYPLLHSREE